MGGLPVTERDHRDITSARDGGDKLFSIVFGEGITNDAVSIILFNTVVQYTANRKSKGENKEGGGPAELDWKTPFEITSQFCSLFIESLWLGVLFALLSAYILKKFRFFSESAVWECVIIFSFGFMSYLVSELTESSGIITLLTAGIVMAQYTWYNLSPQGKQASYVVYTFLGFCSEAFIFSYLGVTFFSYGDLTWSP